MSNVINKPPTKKDGLYRGELHNDPVTGEDLGGIQSIIDGVKKVEIEDGEYHICREAMESNEVYEFKQLTNKEVLNKLFRDQGCVFEQGKSKSGDFIVCRLVVLDDKKYDRKGTVKEIMNQMQSEKSCKMTSDAEWAKDMVQKEEGGALVANEKVQAEYPPEDGYRYSAGIAVVYQNKILLTKPTNSRDWQSYSIPKGQIEAGETYLQGALREVQEETAIGLSGKHINQLKDQQPTIIDYVRKKNFKTRMAYFILRIDSLEEIGLNSEIVPKEDLQLEEVEWAGFVDFEEAMRRIVALQAQIVNHVETGGGEGATEISKGIFISRYPKKINVDDILVEHRYHDKIKAGELGLFAGAIGWVDTGYGDKVAYISISPDVRKIRIQSSFDYLADKGLTKVFDPEIFRKYGFDTLEQLYEDAGSLHNPSDSYYESQKRAVELLRKERGDFDVLEMMDEDDNLPHQFLILTATNKDIEFQEGGEMASGGSMQLAMNLDEPPAPDGLVVDAIVKKLKTKYIDMVDKITNLPVGTQLEQKAQRDAVIDWVTKPENDVKVIIAFSGGKDSVAMVLYALFVLKIPKERIELWHHDVDGHGESLYDWACTPSYCKAFAEAFGLRLLFSYAGGGILREMYRENETVQSVFYQQEPDGEFIEVKPRGLPTDNNTRRMFPAVEADLSRRWCSWIAKISVMRKAINNWSKYKNASICIMTGERRQESTARSKYNEVEKSANASSTRRAIQWRPIIDWSEKQVWDIIAQHRVQAHPCYELGWGRCSCQICIFSSANTWASINEISPEKIKRIAEIEKDLGHTLYNEFERVKTDKVYKSGEKKGQPIFEKGKKLDNIYDERVNRGKSFISKETKDRWIKEALGEFVSPIIVDKWKAPAGAFNGETSGAN